MKSYKILMAGIAVMGLVGCVENMGQQRAINTGAGTLIGAGLGMAVSNEADKTKGALVGAGLGALLGNYLTNPGRSQQPMAQTSNYQQQNSNTSDYRNRAIAQAHDNALRMALKSGSPQRWRSSGASGTIYPTSSWDEYGKFCRGFDSTIIDSQTNGSENFSGEACQQPDGSWKQV